MLHGKTLHLEANTPDDSIVNTLKALASAPRWRILQFLADGGRSVIREKIVGDPLPPATGHMCYRAVLKIDEVPKDLRLPAATL